MLLAAAAIALLVAGAVAALAAGDASPAWIERIGDVAGASPEASMRATSGILVACALAAIALPSWRHAILRTGTATLALAAIATISGGLRGPSMTLVVAACLAALGGGAFVLLGRTSPAPAPSLAGPAWRLLGLLACGTLSLAAAAALPARGRQADEPVAPHRRGAESAQGAVDLMVNRWEGLTIDETGLFTYMPALRSLIGPGTTYLVFYNARCGHCHEFFRRHFSAPITAPDGPTVIAIEIPLAPGERSLPSDQPEEIECPSCAHAQLPTGPVWVLSPPTVVRIEDGVVTCANEPPMKKDCVEGSPDAGADAPTR